ncbi:hypothetical protein GCM10027043_28850 [Ferruginibacter profundus]
MPVLAASALIDMKHNKSPILFSGIYLYISEESRLSNLIVEDFVIFYRLLKYVVFDINGFVSTSMDSIIY